MNARARSSKKSAGGVPNPNRAAPPPFAGRRRRRRRRPTTTTLVWRACGARGRASRAASRTRYRRKVSSGREEGEERPTEEGEGGRARKRASLLVGLWRRQRQCTLEYILRPPPPPPPPSRRQTEQDRRSLRTGEGGRDGGGTPEGALNGGDGSTVINKVILKGRKKNTQKVRLRSACRRRHRIGRQAARRSLCVTSAVTQIISRVERRRRGRLRHCEGRHLCCGGDRDHPLPGGAGGGRGRCKCQGKRVMKIDHRQNCRGRRAAKRDNGGQRGLNCDCQRGQRRPRRICRHSSRPLPDGRAPPDSFPFAPSLHSS